MAKPASGTALDTGHALYTGLTAAWGLLEGSGTTSADSKGSRTLTLSSSGLWATNGSGENIIRIATAVSQALAPASALAFDGNTSYSIAWRAKQSADDFHGVFAGDNTTNSDFFWMDSGEDRFGMRSTGTGSTTTVGAASDFTSTANYVLTYTALGAGNGNFRLYVNGSLSGSATGSVPGAININTLGGGYNSTSLALQGDLEYVYVWSGRVLSGSEATDLNANPYVIFSGTSPTPAVTINHPVAYQTFQRLGAESAADLVCDGTYGGSPVSLEADFAGRGYTTVVSSPAAGAWASKKPRQAKGAGTLTFRHSDDHSITDSKTPVLVGDIYLVIGQSNAAGRGTNNQSYTGTSGWASKRTAANAWAVLADPTGTDGSAAGSVWPLVATSIVNTAGVPACFINRAVGATSITQWLTGQSNYTAARTDALLVSPVIKAALWWQGENDAADGMSAATYYNNLVTLAGNLWADLRCPLVACKLQNCSDSNVAAGQAAINSAIGRAWVECPYVYPGPDLSGINTAPDDSVHLITDAKLASAAALWYAALATLFYPPATGGGLLAQRGFSGGIQ